MLRGGHDLKRLDRLFATIAARKGADPSQSYTAKLLAQGVEKCAKKFGEEAIEAVIAAIQKRQDRSGRRNPPTFSIICGAVGGRGHHAGRCLCGAESARRHSRAWKRKLRAQG